MDINNRIEKRTAERLVQTILDVDDGPIIPSRHAKSEMVKDDLIINDLLNVLRGGRIDKIKKEDFDWVYEISTKKITVIFKFTKLETLGIKIITCWRNDGEHHKKK